MNVVTIEFFKMREDAILPEYSHKGDSGFKMSIPDDVVIKPGDTVTIPLGWACRLPEGHELQIRSRSGLASKNVKAKGNKGSGLVVAQGTGTVDNPYRGEVGVILYNRGYKGTLHLKRGDNVAQGIIAELPDVAFTIVDDWDDTETTRGSGGYGSTGQ